MARREIACRLLLLGAVVLLSSNSSCRFRSCTSCDDEQDEDGQGNGGTTALVVRPVLLPVAPGFVPMLVPARPAD